MGLLENVESENELAFVLGHELGHFRNRDHLRGLGRGIAFSLVLVAGGRGRWRQCGRTRVIGRPIRPARLRPRSGNRGRTASDSRCWPPNMGTFQEPRISSNTSPNSAARWTVSSRAIFSTHPLNDDRVQVLQVTAREMGWELQDERRPLPALSPAR